MIIKYFKKNYIKSKQIFITHAKIKLKIQKKKSND